MSSGPSLSRRSSLADYISAIPRPRLASLRSRKSTVSIHIDKYTPYAVHQQKMSPAILRDADATQKLLEAILDTPGGRRSVSRLARTCKAFKEPALDVLWRDLDSLTPLLGLFPSTILRRARRPGLGLTKPPEKQDWARLLAYGPRVRSVAFVESSGNIHPSILPLLDEHKPAGFLLPNLTALTWKVESAPSLERIRMFLGPRVESVVLEVGTRNARLNDLLEEIAAHKGLTAFAFTLHTNLPDSFTETFQENVALEKLALTAPGALASKVGKWASALPQLKTFAVDLSARTTTAVEGFFEEIGSGSGYSTPSSVGGTDSGVFSGDEFDFSEARRAAVRLTHDGPRRGAFAKLSNLTLTGDAANLATFLRHLTSPLTQLDLVMEDPPSAFDWHDLCRIVSDHFADTLQSLRVNATSASRFGELVRATSRGGDLPMRELPLTHLGKLPRLWRLEIDLPESVVFHEQDVAHIAHICPNIEILRLCPAARFPVSGPPPPLTLESLVPLTRDCLRLHTLAVVVNAAELESDDVYGTRTVCSRALLRLHVGHSWVKNPLQAAVLLSHLAPYLETLKWFNEKNRAGIVEANALAWQRIAEFLPHLQHLRLAERKLQPPPERYVPPPKADKGVDATVSTSEAAVSAYPETAEFSVQAEPELVDFGVQMQPETHEVEIDATPIFVEVEVMAVPEVYEQSIDAVPETEEKGTEPLSLALSDSDSEASDESSRPENNTPSITMFIPSAAKGIANVTYRVVRFYTAPIRFMFSFMPSMSLLPFSSYHASPSNYELKYAPEQDEKHAPAAFDTEPSSPATSASAPVPHTNGTAIAADINPASDNSNIIISSSERFCEPSKPSHVDESAHATRSPSIRFQFGASVPERAPDFHVTETRGATGYGRRGSESLNATRQSTVRTATSPWYSSPSRRSTYNMAEPKKQEKDYTKEVDALLPEATSLAAANSRRH
ncbi:hypothetical protein C8Q78DRAFT_622453 [Trametes maxima]|nr:hypothetical protein C8Q78DRAFT_622453 [Trametes maxima]